MIFVRNELTLSVLTIGCVLALGCTGVTINDGDSNGDGATCTEPGAVALTPTSGSVMSKSNCLGIQGDLWSSSDGHSSVTPVFLADTACIRGQVAQVVGKDYDTYWGVVAGLNLNQPPNGQAKAYDATAHGLSGFNLGLSGTAQPPAARMRIQLQDTQDHFYCQAGVTSAARDYQLADFHENCWTTAPGGTPPPSSLKSVALMITAEDAAPLSFNLCLALAGLHAD
jgi:hypothetical protein